MSSKSPLKIIATDIIGDCPRLNRRFDLVEGQASDSTANISDLKTTVSGLKVSVAAAGPGDVMGGSSLADIGRMTKVTEENTIGETTFSDKDVVLGAKSLIDVGRIPKITAAGTVTESALKDNGTVVSGTEPLHLDTGATPPASQISLTANGLGALEAWCYAAGNEELLFDCKWVGGTLIAANTTCTRLVKDGNALYFTFAHGQTIGNPVTDAAALLIDLTTGFCRFGGVTAPAYQVDVTGDINVSGAVRVGGVAIVSAIVPPAPLTAAAVGQTLTTAYADATGMTFNLTRTGVWIISVTMGFTQATGDFCMNAQLMIGGVVQSPIIQVDDGGIAAAAILNASNTWVYTSAAGNETAKVQVKKVSGVAASGVTSLSSMVARWYKS